MFMDVFRRRKYDVFIKEAMDIKNRMELSEMASHVEGFLKLIQMSFDP